MSQVRVLSLLVCAAIIAVAEPAQAAGTRKAGPLGVGLMLGGPSAVGLRYWGSPDIAFQAWLGGMPGQRGLRLSGDAIFGVGRDFYSSPSRAVTFDFWLGVGAAVGLYGGRSGYYCYNDGFGRLCRWYDGNDGDLYLGARGPLGFSLWINKISLECFVELAPTVVLSPFVGLGFDGGVGARFFF